MSTTTRIRRRPDRLVRICAVCREKRPLDEFCDDHFRKGHDRTCSRCKRENPVLPGKPLAAAVLRWAHRMGYDETIGGREAGVKDRLLYSWRVGSRDVRASRADEVLVRIDRLWFDVWNEDTVRRPALRVVTYVPRCKVMPETKGRKMYRYLDPSGTFDYGDLGPDMEELERVRYAFEGDPWEMAA